MVKAINNKSGTSVKHSEETTAHKVFDDMSEPNLNSKNMSSDSYTSDEEDSYTSDEEDSNTEDEVSPSTEDVASQQHKDQPSTSSVNLLKDNRKPSTGFNLKASTPSSEDEVLLDEGDIQPLEEAWGHSLIGYIAGRCPGKKVVWDFCQKWGVKYSYSAHDSGWLVFKFENKDDMNKVLSEGPYFIFRWPLLLKVMPPLFDFGYEELSKIPVWVKLRNLPLELWNPRALGKILTKVGSPILTDQLTATKRSISFARALVEVDASQNLIHKVRLKLPNGHSLAPQIEYESMPSFCHHCKMIGHSMETCEAAGGELLVSQKNQPLVTTNNHKKHVGKESSRLAQ